MATIVIAPFQETGHIYATLCIGKALRSAGHRVIYVGVLDFRGVVEAEGFEHVALCKQVLPRGWFAAQAVKSKQLRGIALWASQWDWTALASRHLAEGYDDEVLLA